MPGALKSSININDSHYYSLCSVWALPEKVVHIRTFFLMFPLHHGTFFLTVVWYSYFLQIGPLFVFHIPCFLCVVGIQVLGLAQGCIFASTRPCSVPPTQPLR